MDPGLWTPADIQGINKIGNDSDGYSQQDCNSACGSPVRQSPTAKGESVIFPV